jgi:hypothetical protein
MNYNSLRINIRKYLKRYYYKNKLPVKRINKALELIKENKIVILENSFPFENLYYIKGKKGDYYVIKNVACTCYGFVSLLVKKYKMKPCYHILACTLVKNYRLDKKKINLEGLVDSILLK